MRGWVVLVLLVGACGSDGGGAVAPDPEVLSQRCSGFAGALCPEGYACVGGAEADAQGACRLRCAGEGSACADGATCTALPGCQGQDCQHYCAPARCDVMPCPLEGQSCVDDRIDTCEPAALRGQICVAICVTE